MGGFFQLPTVILKLGTGLYEGLSGLVGLVLLEVLDEPSGEVLCLLLPLCGIGIGVARIKDSGVNSFEDRRNREVEVRDDLCRSLVDAVVEDGVDDSTGVADRDPLSGSVPAGVHEISLGTASLHPLHKLLGILGRMQFEEGLAEAGGEGRGGLGDSALGSCEFSGEAGEEVVLGLLGIQYGNRRKDTESIGGQEDDLLCCGSVLSGRTMLLMW